MKRILILYRELAGYFVECLNHLCENYGVEAVVVAYPVNADAPFRFALSEKITLMNRNEISASEIALFVSDPQFDLIFCGGWSDITYLDALKRRKTKALLGFDNQWNGSLKHIASSIYARWKIKPYFEYAFVPGEKQHQFARHMGFASSQIIVGAYACDTQKFASLAEIRKNRSSNQKKKLIYTGRYAHEKFIRELCLVIQQINTEDINDWELHCIGTGALWNERIQSNGIFHHGFMQPEELYEFMKTGDAFILPSTFEPWGVVVHEFASAGYPMILSSNVGAGEIFLLENQNGYFFQAGDAEELKKKLKNLFALSNEKLMAMGEKSAELAQQITPDTWAKSLYQIM